MTKRRYNWLPDLPDQRDFLFAVKVPEKAKLPLRINLTSLCSTVENQGAIGSCTGNALAGALEYLQNRELGDTIDDSTEVQVYNNGHFDNVSRLFIYYNERAIEGTTDQDAGAMLRDGIKSLNKWGACREDNWKYLPTNVFKRPVTKVYQEGKKHCISMYLRLQSLIDMKQCLADGYPFVFGFSVYESFESPKVAKTGIMPMPHQNERLLGGHAVMAAGYDDKNEMLLVRNSWGDKWGQKGYFWMPYSYVENPQLALDFWTIRK